MSLINYFSWLGSVATCIHCHRKNALVHRAVKSKPTWKLKHANSVLEYFEYFCQISSKSIVIIWSYTVSKSLRFFETQCIKLVKIELTRVKIPQHVCFCLNLLWATAYWSSWLHVCYAWLRYVCCSWLVLSNAARVTRRFDELVDRQRRG